MLNLSTESARELHLDEYGLPIIGDANSPDWDDMALENLGLVSSDDMAQERARLSHYGSNFATAETITEDFITSMMARDWSSEGEMDSGDEDDQDWVDFDDEDSELEFDSAPVELETDFEEPEYDDSWHEASDFHVVVNGQTCRSPQAVESVVEAHELVLAFASHELVKVHGLSASKVAESGPEVIGVIKTAVDAVIELGENPADYGFDRLFDEAGELQAKVEAARKPTKGIPPRRRRADRANNPAAVTATRPAGADWLGRVETPHGLALICSCGCGQRVLETSARVPGFADIKRALDSKHVEVWHLHKVVRIKGHHNKRMRSFSFTETRDRMMEQLERWETSLGGTNPIIRDGHRSTRFVVQLSAADARTFRELYSKRQKTELEWTSLHDAAGTHRTTVQELKDKAIPVWEAEAKNLLHTVPLRQIGRLVHQGQQRQKNHLAWKQREMRRQEEAPKMETANDLRRSLGLPLR